MEIFVNKIIYNKSSYNKFKRDIDNELLFISDDVNLKKDDQEKILYDKIMKRNCEYMLYIIYENESYISNNDFNVKELYIYRLFTDTNIIKRSLLFNTSNKYYIEYILSISMMAIDNKSPIEYYYYISNSDIIERLSEFIFKLDKQNCLVINELSDTYKICFSNSFKRLQDKAQVFTSAKGDHYRNRLIHTNEVIVISKLIVDEINKLLQKEDKNLINVENVIAIAMGHDIGHTPFGHQGERTLNNIIELENLGIIKNSGKILYNRMGGFKHNIQSVRVLSVIENDKLYCGELNISPEVLEGILKHTKFNSACANNIIPDCFDKLHGHYDICFEINNNNNKNLVLTSENFNDREVIIEPQTGIPFYMLSKYSYIYNNTYISGEIVAFADEIAQRCSDVEDAIRSKLISIDKLKHWLDDMDYSEITKGIDLDKFDEKICIKILRTNITSYYLNSITKCIKDTEFKHIYFDRRLFNFNNILDKYIQNKLITSIEIAKFDSLANTVISTIFKCYYNNPRLLNRNFTKKIFYEMIGNTYLKNNSIYFSEMNKEYIDETIKGYTNVSINDILLIDYFLKVYDKNEIVYNVNYGTDINFLKKEFSIANIKSVFDMSNREIKDLEKIFYEEIANLNRLDSSEISELERNDKVILNDCDKISNITNKFMIEKLISFEQQKIIVRAICDYIAGMTDTFALSEYRCLLK